MLGRQGLGLMLSVPLPDERASWMRPSLSRSTPRSMQHLAELEFNEPLLLLALLLQESQQEAGDRLETGKSTQARAAK